jgi:hypothetical protein
MTTRYVIAPAADRTLFRRILGRADEILGFPRTHSTAEGNVQIASGAAAPVTEAAFAVFLHDNTGATILHGAVAAQVNGISDLLAGRFFENGSGVRKRLSAWIADQGWEVRADLPGVRSAWTRVAHRDGAAGSATGVPIPEGSE